MRADARAGERALARTEEKPEEVGEGARHWSIHNVPMPYRDGYEPLPCSGQRLPHACVRAWCHHAGRQHVCGGRGATGVINQWNWKDVVM